MKRMILVSGIVIAALQGCKEKAPLIHLTPEPAKVDSSYVVSPTPAADPHNVLIEDFTGVTCPNCPAAHDNIISMVTQYNTTATRVIPIGLYITNYPQTTPRTDAKFDFRSEDARAVQDDIYQSLSGMPIGGVDRLPLGASSTVPYQISPSKWNDIVGTQLNIQDSINLDLNSSYDAATGKAKIKVTVTYLYPTTTAQNVSIAIVEDGFVDYQEDNRIPVTNLDSFYHFNDVFRGFVTSVPFGDAIVPAHTSKEAGFRDEITYNYVLNTAWKPENCKVIAFVHKGQAEGGTHIYQAKETKLKP